MLEAMTIPDGPRRRCRRRPLRDNVNFSGAEFSVGMVDFRDAGNWPCRPASPGLACGAADAFPLFRTRAGRQDLGAKLGANDRNLRATAGHNQLTSEQLDGSLNDTARHTAMLRRCLLSSGSRVRVLPGALGFWVLGRSRPDLPSAQGDPSIPTRLVGYCLPGRCRGHDEDSIYWDE
jgi:hypothetical protein